MTEPIEKVIDRCEFRMERSLNCNVDDIRRLISEVRTHMMKSRKEAHNDPIVKSEA